MFDFSDTTCEGALDYSKEEYKEAYSFYVLLASISITAAMIGYGLFIMPTPFFSKSNR